MLEKLYVSKDYVCIKFVVKDEVGNDKEKAIKEGKRWHVYVVEVNEEKEGVSVKIEFRWITWEKMRVEEVCNFLRSLGVSWDEETTDGLFRKVRYLYKNGNRIATLEEPRD